MFQTLKCTKKIPAPHLVAQNGDTIDDPQAIHSPLHISRLSVAYQNKPVLFSIDATLSPEKLTAIVGPNGAGKSTLLKAALGLVPKLSGTVTSFGLPMPQALANIAYVPQRTTVDWDFPVEVFDVVMMGLSRELGLLKPVRQSHRDFALECLEKVGMADFAHRQIGQLSGGQQQRVFLARALAQNARTFVLDEPFAGVDAATERAIIDVLENLKSSGKSVICVHHDLNTLEDYFDEILMLNVKLIAHGTIKKALSAENLRQTYGGHINTQFIDLSAKTG